MAERSSRREPTEPDAFDNRFLEEAVRIARENVLRNEGGPFGAVVIHRGEIVGRGANRVTARPDPTAHAEIEAIRDAAFRLGTFDLGECILYSSCEPCPLCLAALYLARIRRAFYGSSAEEAAAAGFLDIFLREELSLPPERRKLSLRRVESAACREPFRLWSLSTNKVPYQSTF
ncbi:dCMP deaminase [Methylacidimicrobium cyclopophantes]|uniref:dCMP deaminase n=1 Tax=Methylacidimicrobium cyclopophantes TaxID=1041766 RepID=A0A5E6MDE4_9BACT|nr:nucleoside deaminase [Methylacidimicrobium cyclopophantes]VVM07232.1 dCMP deaminase [Methylacidimicrobium cyclopophantes]